MNLSPEQLSIFRELLSLKNSELDVIALARLAGLDPRLCFAGGDWRGVDFGPNDLSGFDFSRADLRGADLSRATGLERILTDAKTRLPREIGHRVSPFAGNSPDSFFRRQSIIGSNLELPAGTALEAEMLGHDAAVFSRQSGNFSVMLDWHLRRGTRPDGTPYRLGTSWSNQEFAKAIGISEGTVRAWRGGQSFPSNLKDVSSALFGENPLYDRWTLHLRAARFDQPLPKLINQRPIRWDELAVSDANEMKDLGDGHLPSKEYGQARVYYENALSLFQHIGLAALGEANSLQRLGDLHLLAASYATAQRFYEKAGPLYRIVEDAFGEANCLKNVGNIALYLSDHDTARVAYDQALPLYRQVGHKLSEANCIERLGDIALRQSDLAHARAAYECALPLYRELGVVISEANCVRSLADIACVMDPGKARAVYEEALSLYRLAGNLSGMHHCMNSLLKSE